MDDKIQLSKMAQTGFKIILIALGVSIAFFIPFVPLSLVISKGLVLTLGAALGLAFYFLDCISVGRFVLPRGKTWKVFLLLVLSAAVTSFFVPNPLNSFIGSGFDTMTVSTLSIAFIYFFLLNLWGVGINFTKNIFKTVFISGFVVILFSVLQLVFNLVGKFPKVFVSLNNSNLVGTFHDLAFVLSIFVVLLTVSIESNFWRGPMKVVSTIFVVLSLSLLFIINYTLLWYVVGLSGLALLIVQLMPQPANSHVPTPDGSAQINNLISKKRNFSVIAFLIVFCAFIGIIGSSSITQFFAKPPFNFSINEARPSINSSLTIAKHTYYYHPLTGAGLNRFNQSWEAGKHKILDGRLLGSNFWNASFSNAYSVFLGFAVTLGLVSGILFLGLVYFFGKNIVSLFNKRNIAKSRSRDLLIYGFTSVYAFLILMFDVPNTALFILIIAIMAMVVARNQTMDGLTNKEIWFIHDSRHSFFGILSLLAMTILLCFITFVMLSSFYASYLVNRASLRPVADGGILKAESGLAKAISIHSLDAYARLETDAHLVGVNNALQDTSLSEEVIKNTVTTEITNAATSAKLAISIDPKNYQNYTSLLKVQETLFQLGDTTSYEDFIQNSDKILSLSPNNVGIIMRQAKVAVILKKYEEANAFLDKLVAINPYYTDAYVLRSQISLTNGNASRAIDQINEGIELNKTSAVLYYQKGLIYMNQGNYEQAVNTLELALRLAPNSLDLYSALAASYDKLGQKDSVIRVLTTARQYVSDKTQIDTLIEKVKNGGSFSSSAPIEPEKKEETVKAKSKATTVKSSSTDKKTTE